MRVLVVEHLLLLAARAAALLAALLLALLLLGALASLFAREDAFGERTAREPAVDFSRAVLAAAYLDAGRPVEKAHDGRSLVSLLSTRFAAEAIVALGVAPDFTSDDGVVWIHRRDKSADWYFVARDNAEDKSFEASFRQTGRTPEIWNAETGAISDAKVWREEKGRTIVTLDFKPSGSAFVVFRRPATNRHLVSAKPLEVNCRPDPVLAEKPHTLVIKKAEYGVFGCGRPDCNSVAERIKPGVKVGVNNGAMGGDPAFGSIKQLEVRYTLDGKAKRDVASEGSHYTLPKNAKLSGAWYGVIDPEWNPPTEPTVFDITEKLASLVKDGKINVVAENALVPRDPLFKTVKQMRVTYVLDGKETTATLREHERFNLPDGKIAPLPPPVWDWLGDSFVAWQPMKMEFAAQNAAPCIKAFNPPAAVRVAGPWKIAFPACWDAPATRRSSPRSPNASPLFPIDGLAAVL